VSENVQNCHQKPKKATSQARKERYCAVYSRTREIDAVVIAVSQSLGMHLATIWAMSSWKTWYMLENLVPHNVGKVGKMR